MNNNYFLNGPEDEMEFMPMIPLHEDNDSGDEQVIATELPLLPLRNTVLFPGVVILALKGPFVCHCLSSLICGFNHDANTTPSWGHGIVTTPAVSIY